MLLLRSLLVAAFLMLAPCLASAQQQWSKWYFGLNAGLDFTSGSPRLIRGLTTTLEGTAAIAHPTNGAILFYTDGVTVWNRDHVPMPNGRGLLGHYSTTQSALIVPMPGIPNRYYLFTADAFEDMEPGKSYDGINYSIVDMSLDNGRG
ncbi:MAG: hypothetical protein H7X80_01120, partial [bacterium]|nr:hypothetical protein [Candidatus Kapabacteria bacterium]